MNDHVRYIRRCLELAAKGRGQVAPNPMVGAVLVHEGRIIGEGWHRHYGQAHAEVNCLTDVKEADRCLIPQSTMYVSLEPCAHYGKTPPCAERLVSEGVREVIICNDDPFEQVKGRGIEILNTNGVATQSGILAAEGSWLNRRFFCFHQQQRPYIMLKWAQTGQGYFAPLNRTRFQMSNRHSQQLVHKWRTEESAIMVGYHTALSDDPQLTARLWEGRQPLRIVVDRDLNLPPHLHLFNTDAPTWVINSLREAQNEHIRYIKLDFNDSLLQQLLGVLKQASILSLFVEGGATLLGHFISQGLWDEACIFTAEAQLSEGLQAPLLKQAEHVMQTSLEGDMLDVYVNQSSPYKYVDGMEL